MRTLSIDIETYSSIDLSKAGVYRYTEAPDFSILMLAYAFNDEPVKVVDLASGEELPEEVHTALYDTNVLKTAHNANFERTCIAKHFDIELPANQWECTMIKAAMLGLPFGLDMVSKVLKLEEGKSAAGKTLIRYFSIPCKATKVNGGRERNLPEHDPEKWQEFKNYCVQDVVVERSIRNKLSFFAIPTSEKLLWSIDQEINDNGVLVDLKLVRNAISIDNAHRTKLTAKAVELTGLDNPNSVSQLKKWINDETGGSIEKLTKETVTTMLKDEQADEGAVRSILQIRQEMSKTSVMKYEAMVSAVCRDGRIRGLLQFYGANRTGRWAGRLVQVQNLPRIELLDLDLARNLVREGDGEMLELLYGNVPDTLSQLIRTSFIAPEGCRFIAVDYSAIEARVIAWLAGERWRLQVFCTHGKIYEASAAQMFKVPIESVTKASPLRQKGKVAELALGYQGGPNALIKMGALNMGLVEEELPKLVKMWRNANKRIVDFWETVGNAAIEAVETGTPVTIAHSIKFFVEKGVLFIQLPSGRRLSYMRPTLIPSKFGGLALTYEGMDQTTKQWKRMDTYGGKLVENIVQAIARDCLATSIIRLHTAGYKIAMHIHDEVVLEMPEGKGSTEEVNTIMGTPMDWAQGLPLTAESYETYYYKKD